MNAAESLLGALMLAPERFWAVSEVVGADDFDGLDRRLWLAIRDQVTKGEPVDYVTIAEVASDLASHAAELGSGTLTPANALVYANVLRREGEARRLKRAGHAIAVCADYDEAQALLAAVRPRQAQKLKTVKDGLSEMVEALQRRYDQGEVSGVPTGLDTLDKITAGWQSGNLIVVAARPGMGKTAMAVQSAIAAGRSLVFSLEMTAGELTERTVAHVGRVPLKWMRFPLEAPDHASAAVLESSKQVAKLELLIDDSPSLSVDSICSRARQAHMQSPLSLIVVDHLGLIARPGKHDPSELGAITAQLKRLAKDLGIPVVLLCQLNRGLEARADKRPTLSDLRDSGRIEEDADVVIGLYREGYYVEKTDNLAELIVLKNRSGEKKTAWAIADLGVMRFEPSEARPDSETGEPERNEYRTQGFRKGFKPTAVAGTRGGYGRPGE